MQPRKWAKTMEREREVIIKGGSEEGTKVIRESTLTLTYSRKSWPNLGIVLNTSTTVKLYCTQEETERESGERWMRGKRKREEKERERQRERGFNKCINVQEGSDCY